MEAELKSLLEEQKRTFEEFKAANDARIAEEVKKGTADVVTRDTVDRLSERLGDLSEEMKALHRKATLGAGAVSDERKSEYRAAYDRWVRGTSDERELKALQVNVGADGGFAVPEEIDRAIMDRVLEISPVRSVATVVTTSTGDYKKLINRRGTASGWVSETAARPETATPVFQEIAPTSGDLYANVFVTQFMLDDAFFDVDGFVVGEVASEFARAEGAAFVSGNGTNRPTGFLAGPTPVTTGDATRAAGTLQFTPSGQASALPTSADVYMDLVATLKAGHRQGAVWMMQKAVVTAIRKLKDTTNQYLWQPGLAAGNPDTLLGYPVVEAEDMPAVAANAFPIAFGNFRDGYIITDRMGVRLLRDPYSSKPYVTFYATKRVGGMIQNSEAIKLLRISVS